MLVRPEDAEKLKCPIMSFQSDAAGSSACYGRQCAMWNVIPLLEDGVEEEAGHCGLATQTYLMLD